MHEAGHAVAAHALSPSQRIELSMRKSYRIFDTNVIAHGATRSEEDVENIVTGKELRSQGSVAGRAVDWFLGLSRE